VRRDLREQRDANEARVARAEPARDRELDRARGDERD
jgi:hypothetical protein